MFEHFVPTTNFFQKQSLFPKLRSYLHKVSFFDNNIHFLFPLPFTNPNEANRQYAKPKEKLIEKGKMLNQSHLANKGLKVGSKIKNSLHICSR